MITNLYRDGPAAVAGLRAGDILIGIDGHEVHNAQDALTQLASHSRAQRELRVHARAQRFEMQMQGGRAAEPALGRSKSPAIAAASSARA